MAREINRSETISRVVNNPADPYGPPLIRFVVRVRERDTGRWYYVKTCHNGRTSGPRYTFTRDPLYARLMSERTARRHQSEMTTDILDR